MCVCGGGIFSVVITCSRSRCTELWKVHFHIGKVWGWWWWETLSQTCKPGLSAAPRLSHPHPHTVRPSGRQSRTASSKMCGFISQKHIGSSMENNIWVCFKNTKPTTKPTSISSRCLMVTDELCFFPSSRHFLCLQPCRLLKQQWRLGRC